MMASEQSITILFESKYKTDIRNFSTTEEVDIFLTKKLGKKSLKLISLDQSIVSKRGCIFPMKNVDIDKSFFDSLKK